MATYKITTRAQAFTTETWLVYLLEGDPVPEGAEWLDVLAGREPYNASVSFVSEEVGDETERELLNVEADE